MWEVDTFSVIGGLFIDERIKKKFTGMYVIAVLMPYINPSFARSGNLDGSGNFATSCEVEPQSPAPSPASSPSKELGTSSDRTDGQEIPGVRLDVTSLPEDTDPQPASSEHPSPELTFYQLPQEQRGRGAVPAEGWPARLSGAVRWLLRPGVSRGGAVPPGSRRPLVLARLRLAGE